MRCLRSLLPRRRILASLAGVLAGIALAVPAMAQSLTVLPVTIALAPGQLAAALTVINQNDREMSFQVRGFAWRQPNGEEELVPTDELMVSPPLGTIPPNASHVIRLALRQAPVGQEGTYRVLVDQIPAPAQPGTVRIAMRLSIPVFAQPDAPIAPRLQWRIERDGRQAWLVVTNTGTQHEKVTGIALTGADGRAVAVQANASPYVLAGVTRRWPVSGTLPAGALRLAAQTNAARVNVQLQP